MFRPFWGFGFSDPKNHHHVLGEFPFPGLERSQEVARKIAGVSLQEIWRPPASPINPTSGFSQHTSQLLMVPSAVWRSSIGTSEIDDRRRWDGFFDWKVTYTGWNTHKKNTRVNCLQKAWIRDDMCFFPKFGKSTCYNEIPIYPADAWGFERGFF